jgi:ABC-type phosphate/phosphonate transport system substrate-binding protein
MSVLLRHHLRLIMLISCALLVVLVGCRRLEVAPQGQRPTPTPTPRSTHLPPVPTPVPIGAPGNPLRVVFPETESGRSSAAVVSAAGDLQSALAQATGLTVEVDVVETNAEALAQLCASTPDQLTVAWLGGVTYAAAYAENCGTAALHFTRGTLENARTGIEVGLYGNRANGVNTLGDLSNKIVCRLGYNDTYTWLVPYVMMRASGGEDLIGGLRELRDYDDLDTLIDALSDGDCDVAGMSVADFEERANASSRSATVSVTRSIEIPYAILVIPSLLPAGQAAALTDAFISIGNGARGELLRPLVLQDEIVRSQDADFARLRTFFSQAQLDLSELGT